MDLASNAKSLATGPQNAHSPGFLLSCALSVWAPIGGRTVRLNIAAAPKAPGAKAQHSLADSFPDILGLAAED